jgi:hypothetical protein
MHAVRRIRQGLLQTLSDVPRQNVCITPVGVGAGDSHPGARSDAGTARSKILDRLRNRERRATERSRRMPAEPPSQGLV